ncbi:MAG: response regulator transcription factor [Aquimonas sp.]|nr:response regulator transcription factor [Aquimonas sp.]
MTAGGSGLQVVVVEDDPEYRSLLQDELSERGFKVAAVPSAEALYRHMATQPCHIVVLDIGLPGEDGYSVAEHLQQTSAVRVLMLTGRESPTDIARGLNTGADMYLTKPVDFEVLAAAVANLARRFEAVPVESTATPGPSPGWALLAEGWTLQTPDGQRVSLREQERAFLQCLFATPAQPVPRETLIEALTSEPWNFDAHRLEVLVHRLRARVKAAAGCELPVRALRGAGYLYTN